MLASCSPCVQSQSTKCTNAQHNAILKASSRLNLTWKLHYVLKVSYINFEGNFFFIVIIIQF